MFGDQIADKCLELNDSDVEILESLSSELNVNTMEEKVHRELKPVVKLERIKQEVKSEFRPVGFSKSKHQGAAKYNRALKALVKAKKEHASLEVKKEQLWLCKVCSRGYKSYNGCYKHEKLHEDFKLACGICGKGFNYKKDLKLHLPVHSKELKVFCPDCGKGFASDRSLARHAALHQKFTVQLFRMQLREQHKREAASSLAWTTQARIYYTLWRIYIQVARKMTKTPGGV